jgi:hypothetical protein
MNRNSERIPRRRSAAADLWLGASMRQSSFYPLHVDNIKRALNLTLNAVKNLEGFIKGKFQTEIK